jgi:hypothetical protein
MNAKFVRDVIGEPESWPNYMQIEWQKSRDMRGARITSVFILGGQLAIQTRGAVCGKTFSTFVVEDRHLRDRLARVLRPDLSVHEAVAVEI